MRRTVRLGIQAVIWLGVTLLPGYPLAGASLEGRWKLVEQTFGSGAANYAEPGAPLRIEFKREGPRLAGTIWIDGERARALPWPAFTADEQILAIEGLHLSDDPVAGSVRAGYRVRSFAQDGESLEVVEEYQLTDGGRALSGTVTLTPVSNTPSIKTSSPPHIVWHRRFEREP